jgi:hypothetical protein
VPGAARNPRLIGTLMGISAASAANTSRAAEVALQVAKKNHLIRKGHRTTQGRMNCCYKKDILL